MMAAISNEVAMGRRTAVENGVLAFSERYLHSLHLRHLSSFTVVINDPHEEGAVQPSLDSGGRNNQRLWTVFQDQVDVDELIGKEDGIFVIKDRFELTGASRGVDLVVGREKTATCQEVRVAAVVGIHRDALVTPKTFEHLRQLILRKSEVNSDGLELVDDDKIGRIGGDNVSGINKAEANFPVDR
jgi:hypothetical protein